MQRLCEIFDRKKMLSEQDILYVVTLSHPIEKGSLQISLGPADLTI